MRGRAAASACPRRRRSSRRMGSITERVARPRRCAGGGPRCRAPAKPRAASAIDRRRARAPRTDGRAVDGGERQRARPAAARRPPPRAAARRAWRPRAASRRAGRAAATSASASSSEKHAGQAGGHVLAEAVADHRLRAARPRTSTAAPARTRRRRGRAGRARSARAAAPASAASLGRREQAPRRRSTPSVRPQELRRQRSSGLAEDGLGARRGRAPCPRYCAPRPGTGTTTGRPPASWPRREDALGSRASQQRRGAPRRSGTTTARRCRKALRPTWRV